MLFRSKGFFEGVWAKEEACWVIKEVARHSVFKIRRPCKVDASSLDYVETLVSVFILNVWQVATVGITPHVIKVTFNQDDINSCYDKVLPSGETEMRRYLFILREEIDTLLKEIRSK